MKIMAGMDKEFTGEAGPPTACAWAICRRSRKLDPAKDVRGNVMEGVADKQALVDRYNEIATNYSDETADEMASPAGRDRGQGPVGSRQPGRSGDGRAALSARRWPRSKSSPAASAAASRCASCCWSSRNSAARRTHQPSRRRNRSNGLKAICATIRARHPVVTHDRYFLDNVTSWILELDRGKRHSARRQLFVLPGNAEEKRLQQEGSEEAARQRTIAPRTRMDRRQPQGAPGQVQGAHQAL